MSTLQEKILALKERFSGSDWSPSQVLDAVAELVAAEPDPNIRRLTGLWRFGRDVLPIAHVDFYGWLYQLDTLINVKCGIAALSDLSIERRDIESYPMGEGWRVEVSRYGDQLVAIEPSILAGYGELSEQDQRTIVGCAEHLLAFVGARTQRHYLAEWPEPEPAPSAEQASQQAEPRTIFEFEYEGENGGWHRALAYSDPSKSSEIVRNVRRLSVVESPRAEAPHAEHKAVVVPDEIDEWKVAGVTPENAASLPDGYHAAFARGWNACRDAMLKAQTAQAKADAPVERCSGSPCLNRGPECEGDERCSPKADAGEAGNV